MDWTLLTLLSLGTLTALLVVLALHRIWREQQH